MPNAKTIDSLAPFRRRARVRRVWRWLRWVLLVLVVAMLLLGGVLLRLHLAPRGISLVSRDVVMHAGAYTGSIPDYATTGAR